MRLKYLAMMVAGILTVGSFSILAKEVAPVYTNSVVKEISTYGEIEDLINEKVQSGEMTPEEAEDMIRYCVERMASRGKSGRRYGCH